MDRNPRARLLADPARAGVHRVAAEDLPGWAAAAGEAGLQVFRIDFAPVRDKDALLAAIGEAMDFPEWYGGNLDALADCLADLGWRPAEGYVAIIDRCDAAARSAPGDLLAVLRIFADAADVWREEGIPFWCLVEATGGVLPGLKDLP